MSYPQPYSVSYSYTGFAQSLGDGSFPGSQIDNDLAGFQTSLDATIAFLSGITRSDGALANGIVTTDALDTTLAAALGDLPAIATVEALAAQTAANAVSTAADVVTAAASAAASAASAAALTGTSVTSLTPGAGPITLTTQGGKDFGVGRNLKITSGADPVGTYFAVTVTAYNTATGVLTASVDAYAGSGAHTDWMLKVAGTRGGTGPAGPATIVEKVMRVRTTANVSLSGGGIANGTSIDGITVATGDVIFVAAQTAPAENGVYIAPASGAAARHTDFDTWAEIVDTNVIGVQEGTTYADTLWQFTANAGGTLGTTAVTFKQVNPIATNSTPGLSKVSTTATAATGSATDEVLRNVDAATTYVAQGQHEIGFWPARALIKPTSSPAGTLAQLESTTNKVNDEYLPFVDGSTTYAGFSFRAPKKFDRTANFTAEIEWTEAGSATSHDCKWQVEMQAQGDADTIDSTWGTAVTIVDTGSSGTRRFALTGTITPSGPWAAGDKIHVRVSRLGADAADTLNVDARLIGVTLFAGVNLKNDA